MCLSCTELCKLCFTVAGIELFWTPKLSSRYQNDSRRTGRMIPCIHFVLLELYIEETRACQQALLELTVLLVLFRVAGVGDELARTESSRDLTNFFSVSEPRDSLLNPISSLLNLQRKLRRPGHNSFQYSVPINFLHVLSGRQVVIYQRSILSFSFLTPPNRPHRKHL